MLENACANCIGNGLPLRAESDAVTRMGVIEIGRLTAVRKSARRDESTKTTLRAENTASPGPNDIAGGMKIMIANRRVIVKLPQGLTDDIAMTSGARKGHAGIPQDRDIDLLETKGVRHPADPSRRMTRDGIEIATRITNGESETMVVPSRTTMRNQNRAKPLTARTMNPIL